MDLRGAIAIGHNYRLIFYISTRSTTVSLLLLLREEFQFLVPRTIARDAKLFLFGVGFGKYF